MSAKETAEQLIKDNKVMVFSKSYCPYCTKAKEELTKLTKFKAIELDNTNDGDDIQKALLDMTGTHHIIITIILSLSSLGQKTVPNIFIGGKHIGRIIIIFNIIIIIFPSSE